MSVYVRRDKDKRSVLVYRERDKGISAQGVICVSLKFIMRSDSWRSGGEEQGYTPGSSSSTQNILQSVWNRIIPSSLEETESITY